MARRRIRFNSSLHPRDSRGRFAKKAGSSSRRKTYTAPKTVQGRGRTVKTQKLKNRRAIEGVHVDESAFVGFTGPRAIENETPAQQKLKGNVRARVSTRSASVAYTRKKRISPKLTVYGGVHVGISRAQPKVTVLDKVSNFFVKRVIKLSKIGDIPRVGRPAEDKLKEILLTGQTSVGKTGIGLDRRPKRARTIRSSTTLGQARSATAGRKVRKRR